MQRELRIDDLPPGALEAAATFAQVWVAPIRKALEEGDDMVILLPAAPYDHTDWRRTAARDLARAHAPRRINLLGGGSVAAREKALCFLADAPGVTGQYLPLAEDGRDG